MLLKIAYTFTENHIRLFSRECSPTGKVDPFQMLLTIKIFKTIQDFSQFFRTRRGELLLKRVIDQKRSTYRGTVGEKAERVIGKKVADL